MIFHSYELRDSGPVNLKFMNGNTPHREARAPGADISDLPDGVQTAINAHWTEERTAAYVASLPVKPALTAAQAMDRVDSLAEKERLKYITPGSGQAGVYLQKSAEATAALADESPDAADYPLLAASIGIDGVDITAVATTVQAIAVQWTAIAAHIESVRLNAKKDLADGDTPETVLAALDWSLPE